MWYILSIDRVEKSEGIFPGWFSLTIFVSIQLLFGWFLHGYWNNKIMLTRFEDQYNKIIELIPPSAMTWL